MAAYVRKKRVGDHEYYQLVQSRRVRGQPRQKVLLHLGRHGSVEEALSGWPREIRRLRAVARKDRERLESLPEPEKSAGWAKEIARRAHTAERRADALEGHLKELRDLKKEGSV